MDAAVCAHAGEELWPLEPDAIDRCPHVRVNTTNASRHREALVGPISTATGSWTTIWLPFALLEPGD